MGNIIDPTDICLKLDLGIDMSQSISEIQSNLFGSHDLVGKRKSVINPAIVYLAALQNDCPLSLSQLHTITEVQARSIKRMTLRLSNILDIEIPEKHTRTRKDGVLQFSLYTTHGRNNDSYCHKCYKKQ